MRRDACHAGAGPMQNPEGCVVRAEAQVPPKPHGRHGRHLPGRQTGSPEGLKSQTN